ncbi:STN domain-containing protein [Collimonas fungivorans]|uniref:Outer membrane heme receptor n=1 Tax=Collimonas fungivorans (strain Ter331) TaxID=1005048 RepID=G0AHC6_COLFT|nr:STN domain-containing protein [Collimonas fungivorans]AEK62532.1 outer membrane heme receptor [Collimonas fungivorans Ter331]
MTFQHAQHAAIKVCALLLAASALPAPALNTGFEAGRSYAIAAGPLSQKLALFAATAGISIVYAPESVRNKCSPGLEGNFPLTEAFARLLRGTGLESVEKAERGYLLRGIGPALAPASPYIYETPAAAIRPPE